MGGRTALLTSGRRIEPQPNDTLSEEYFNKVDRAINEHTTPAPAILASASPSAPAAAPLTPFRKVMSANQPYSTKLGASLLYEASADPNVNLPPTQLAVDALLVEQCPMLAFADKLFITAPRCQSTQGTWEESSGRNILRWESSGTSVQSIRLALDSPTTDPDDSPNGTVDFVSIRRQAQMTRNVFEVITCKGTPVFTIEEKLTRVQKLGFGDSTARPHNTAYDKVAYFSQYFVNHMNGSVLAKTNFFRLDEKSVNLTAVASGQILAQAVRTGNWKRSAWRNCTHNQRAWEVTFPGNVRDVDLPGTIRDLRVASTAAILVMALMDEARLPESQIVSASGMRSLGWLVLTWFLVGLCFALVPVMMFQILERTRLGESFRLSCLRCQNCLLPQRVY